jgi:DNA-binding transcriptional MerR regulator
MTTEEWTLDELAQRAGQALAADAVRAPNGRVRERPDGRAIRWYATIGLVDRPSTGRGRAAKYGEHHLLQLVAVKRLQALGRSLAEIQIELAGATEATLRRIAELPEGTDEVFDEVADADAAAPAEFDTSAVEGEPVEVGAAPSAARFWATRPAELDIAVASAAHAPVPVAKPVPKSAPRPAAKRLPAGESARPEGTPAEPGSARDGEPAAVRYEIALSSIVSLTIPTLPAAADLAAIHEAAAPLLDLLADRGLTTVQGVQDEY